MQTGFSPIIDENCTILVLGSLPGVQSLVKQQYYGNTRNRFWHYIFKTFDEPATEDYEHKQSIALKHHIAIWDVIKTADRSGSSDSKIKNAVPNDIPALLARSKNIRKIIFNGSFACEIYIRFFGVPPIPYVKLLSTSPACAGRDNEKLKQWQAALKDQDIVHCI